jgi:hypothetical protein
MVSGRSETFGKLAQFEFQATFPSGWTMQKRLPAEVQFQLQGPFVPYHFPYIGFFSVREVYKDPCHPEAGFAGALRAYQPNANDPEIYANNLETELKSMAGFDAGPSTSATIGGHQARHFTISNGIDTSTAGCTDGELLPLFATMDARDTQTELIWREHSPATNGGTTLEVWIVNGVERSHGLLIVGETGSHDPASGMRAIESILASITFSG